MYHYPYCSPDNEDRITNDGIVVRRYRMLSTQLVIYDAYELTSGAFGPHHTTTTIDGRWYGTLHSYVPDNASFHSLPVGEERSQAVTAHYAANDQRSYDAILEVFPEAVNGHRDNGRIEVWY
jgi:hypothetical protein